MKLKPYKLPLDAPTGEQVTAVRIELGLTQADAAGRVYLSRARWADYEREARPIEIARWHLFLLRSGLLKAGE